MFTMSNRSFFPHVKEDNKLDQKVIKNMQKKEVMHIYENNGVSCTGLGRFHGIIIIIIFTFSKQK